MYAMAPDVDTMFKVSGLLSFNYKNFMIGTELSWNTAAYGDIDKNDFAKVKKHTQDKLDHKYINEVLDGINPTAENMAKWICDEVTRLCEQGICYKVDVQESEGNIATYEVTE